METTENHDRHPVRQCKKCGKDFKQKRKNEGGIFCSRTCSDSFNKNPPAQSWIEKVCPYCKQSFLCPPWQTTAHCSVKCSKRHAAQTTTGENHPLFKPKTMMTCEVCGIKRMVKPSLVSRFRACSNRCACFLGHCDNPRTSSIETAILEGLEAEGIPNSPQYPVGPYLIDVAFPEQRLAVECDGDYWHSEERRGGKDRQKDGYLKSRGWKVLRIKEHRIKSDLTTCIMEIRNALQ